MDHALMQTLQQLTTTLERLTTTLERLDATMVRLVNDMGWMLTLNIGLTCATLLTTIGLWWHGMRTTRHTP